MGKKSGSPDVKWASPLTPASFAGMPATALLQKQTCPEAGGNGVKQLTVRSSGA